MQLSAIPLDLWILTLAIALTTWLMAADAVTFRLPNVVVLGLLALYPLWVMAHPEPVHWAWALMIAGIALAVGMGLFALNVIGAGDAKFAAVAFLWAGPEAGLRYFIYFGLIGGAMSLLLLIMRPVLQPWERYVPRLFRHHEPVAYGLAIGGGLLLIWFLGYAH